MATQEHQFADLPRNKTSLAELLGLSRGELRRLSKEADSRYREHQVPKRGGGTRTLHAPDPYLKGAQRAILHRILGRWQPHEAAHGFRRGRSILTGARPHARQPVVVSLDLEDFFPTVTIQRVIGLLRHHGCPKRCAWLLGRLVTREGRLPQGAPTSPMLANLTCRKLDARLTGLARQQGLAYTRYADDLTLSGPEAVVGCLPLVRQIVEEEGFRLNDRKLRIARRGASQRVTGLVVNAGVKVPRRTRRLLRAALHHARTYRPVSLPGDGQGALTDAASQANRIAGLVSFVTMVHPEQKDRLRSELRRAVPKRLTRLSKTSKPSSNRPDYAAPGERPFFTQRPEWNAKARRSSASPASKPAPGKRRGDAEKVIREQKPRTQVSDINNFVTQLVLGLILFVAGAVTAIWFGLELGLIRLE